MLVVDASLYHVAIGTQKLEPIGSIVAYLQESLHDGLSLLPCTTCNMVYTQSASIGVSALNSLAAHKPDYIGPCPVPICPHVLGIYRLGPFSGPDAGAFSDLIKVIITIASLDFASIRHDIILHHSIIDVKVALFNGR